MRCTLLCHVLCSYCTNPVLVIIDVQPKEMGIPSQAYCTVVEAGAEVRVTHRAPILPHFSGSCTTFCPEASVCDRRLLGFVSIGPSKLLSAGRPFSSVNELNRLPADAWSLHVLSDSAGLDREEPQGVCACAIGDWGS